MSICIVNWNTGDLLTKCLDSIAEPINNRTEIVVVDNASTDGSAEAIRSKFGTVQLIPSDENLGFAKANNMAIHEATGSFIVLLNPDTEVKDGALEKMLEFMETHPGAGAVGPMLLGSDGRMQISTSREPTLWRELLRMLHLRTGGTRNGPQIPDQRADNAQEVDVLQGACLMIRREALDEVGLLDEDYFMYTEEVDLCYRLRKAGWSIHWLPTAKVIHHGGQSTKQVPTESFLNLYQSKLLYFRKHHGPAAAFAYKLILITASLVRLAMSPLALLERREQRQRHLALAGRYGRLLLEMPNL